MKTTTVIITALAAIALCSSSHAQILGESGTGAPTTRVLGTLGGATAGGLIGNSIGGEDGWWIGGGAGAIVGYGLSYLFSRQTLGYAMQSQWLAERNRMSPHIYTYSAESNAFHYSRSNQPMQAAPATK